MAQNTYRRSAAAADPKPSWGERLTPRFVRDPRLRLALGVLLQGLACFLAIAFTSYFAQGPYDQLALEAVQTDGWRAATARPHNWLGLAGAYTAHYLVFRWWGATAFALPFFSYIIGHRLTYRHRLLGLFKTFNVTSFALLWGSLALGYAAQQLPSHVPSLLLGGVGIELAAIAQQALGWGTLLALVVSGLIFIIYAFHITTLRWPRLPQLRSSDAPDPLAEATTLFPEDELASPVDDTTSTAELSTSTLELTTTLPPAPPTKAGEPELTVATPTTTEKVAEKVENYDPTLDLSAYEHPPVTLLKNHGDGKIHVTQEELAQNKDRIISTLTNFKIGIDSIRATIGPTVTLYEIVPAAGVKISRIKNLEDDIALSLAALGIRIIAPIPGKGTIGIEVPNKKREIVPFRQTLATDKFMKSTMELPLIMGKTIENEVLVADLAKMPHLLIAGATGQGKSVGLNVALASLIYKKHPSQLKLVLVDPKKVELSLYSQLEKHFLAKLPSSEESIITATKEVVHTLNSLCIEMDTRYELLKEAGTRNIKEYNEKFVQRKLNPLEGHRFLPYIVLVVDEFADMMMTAGKEVEAPIARLAQLARAIGIHLILATQRPSVNVITGIIKANFPVRISYRVTSKVDSRTILDTGGADQLVGMGDLLLSMNSIVTRLQCPFIDTQEVRELCAFIGNQRGYPEAYQLPVYEEDSEKELGSADIGERDSMFAEAAKLVVTHQQGSTSLIQRKLKLGYNRAGRLMDQLEVAGIVGPFEGSKARKVLFPDLNSLEQFLQETQGA